MTTEPIESTALVVRRDEPAPPPALFGSEDPGAIIHTATARANALAAVIKDRHLYTNIQGRQHVTVEGWTLLGSLCGVFPVVEWSRAIEGGYEARVEARTMSGAVVGAAEAQCTREEKTWRNRDDYALRSMAQTRATSKALRLPLAFVMALAGFDATPAEEMPAELASAPPAAEREPLQPAAPKARRPATPEPDGPEDAARKAFLNELTAQLARRGVTLGKVGAGLHLAEDKMNRDGVLAALSQLVADGVPLEQALDIALTETAAQLEEPAPQAPLMPVEVLEQGVE